MMMMIPLKIILEKKVTELEIKYYFIQRKTISNTSEISTLKSSMLSSNRGFDQQPP